MRRVPNCISGIGVGIKQTAIEEILLDVIGVPEAKLSIAAQSVIDLGGAAGGIGGCDIFADALEDVFGVPNHELESFARRAFADDVPIVLRPIIVAGPMIDDHIVDEIVDIDVLLEQFVLSVVGEAGIGKRENGVPGIEVSGDKHSIEIGC